MKILCPIYIEQRDFGKSLNRFQNLVMQVRESCLGQLVGRSLDRDIFEPDWERGTAKQLPIGTIIERSEEQAKSVGRVGMTRWNDNQAIMGLNSLINPSTLSMRCLTAQMIRLRGTTLG